MDEPDRPKTSEELIQDARSGLGRTPPGAPHADEPAELPPEPVAAAAHGMDAGARDDDDGRTAAMTGASADTPPPRGMSGRQITRLVALLIGVIVAIGFVWVRSRGTTVASIGEGDCFEDPGLGEISRLNTVDCSEPHAFEAFARITLPEGPYPGDFEVVVDAIERCLDDFESYVGAPIEDSGLFADAFVPTRSVWEDGNRDALCVVFDADDDFNPITRSGTARAGG